MHQAVGTLLAVTIGLLLWHYHGMARVIELTTRDGVQVSVADDRFNGGISKVTLERDGGTLTMRCRLARTIAWPGCKIMFQLTDGPLGLDLSGFDAITFDGSYTGPGRHVVRAMLLNFEPGTSSIADPLSQKINEVDFPVPADGRIRVPLNVFHTAPWWNELRKVPLEDTDMRIDNVTRLELQTAAASEAGDHVLVLRSVQLHGKWISLERLVLLLMAAWIACAIAWPLLSAMTLRRALRHSSQRLALLGEVNQALQLEARELADQANLDPLTGALNRQGLRTVLMNTTTLLATPLAVVFVDVDHFKRINDGHGHDVGDAVLRAFAQAVLAEIRACDSLVRWGGEEFLIVCPATSASQAAVLADKLRAMLHRRDWPAGLALTASFGVACRQRDEDIGSAIRRADRALYAAKAGGRDRVVVAEADAATRPDDADDDPPVPATSAAYD